MNTVEKSIVSA